MCILQFLSDVRKGSQTDAFRHLDPQSAPRLPEATKILGIGKASQTDDLDHQSTSPRLPTIKSRSVSTSCNAIPSYRDAMKNSANKCLEGCPFYNHFWNWVVSVTDCIGTLITESL